MDAKTKAHDSSWHLPCSDQCSQGDPFRQQARQPERDSSVAVLGPLHGPTPQQTSRYGLSHALLSRNVVPLIGFMSAGTWQGSAAPAAGASGFAAQAWRLDIHAVVVLALLPPHRVRTSPHRVGHGVGGPSDGRLLQSACVSTNVIVERLNLKPPWLRHGYRKPTATEPLRVTEGPAPRTHLPLRSPTAGKPAM